MCLNLTDHICTTLKISLSYVTKYAVYVYGEALHRCPGDAADGRRDINS